MVRQDSKKIKKKQYNLPSVYGTNLATVEGEREGNRIW
jgi:hypothetical protein